MTENQPANWYPDPSSPGMERWWDGEQWSDRVRPAANPGAAWGSSDLPPPNHLAVAILTTLFCCLPFGVVAIVKASQVNSLWQAGQHDAARQASDEAKKWAWVSFFVALGFAVLWFVLALGAGLGSGPS